MADANLFQLSYVREVTWGATPNSAFTELPIVSGAMTHGQETVRSATLRDDAQLADSKRVGVAPGANYSFELAARLYDTFMRDAVRASADWSTAVNVAGTDIAADSSGNQYTSTITDLSTNVSVGQWIYVAGFTTTGNNGWAKVTAVSTYSMTVSGITLVDEVAGDAITIKGSQIRNGTPKGSYSLQHNYTDLTNRWHILTGARVNNFTMEQTPGGIIACTMAFDGKQRAQAAAGGGTGVVTDAANEDVVTEVDGFDQVWIDTAAISYDVYKLSLAIGVPAIPRKPLGSLYRGAIGQGALNVTGSIEFLLDDNTWAYDTKWQAFTKFMLAFSLDMQGGDRYHFELPQVAFTEEPGNIPGNDQDIILSFGFNAEPGGAFGSPAAEKTIQICRVQA